MMPKGQRNRKSKNHIELKGQMKQDKRANKDLQSTTQKAKDRTE